MVIINVLSMKWAICSNCKHVLLNTPPGTYTCPSCQKTVPFFEFEAFCGAKPGKIYEKD